MFNQLVVVSVTPFSGTTTSDKNGMLPVMLQCIAGKMPNRNVLSGTVAQRAGIEVGKSYLMQVRDQGLDKVFGEDYTWIKVKELSTAEDIIKSTKELGEADIFKVERPEAFETSGYVRKSNAIEGARTKRIKEGLYLPVVQTTVVDHHTAKDVQEGSSASGKKGSEIDLRA